jgi:hypothetical protein
MAAVVTAATGVAVMVAVVVVMAAATKAAMVRVAAGCAVAGLIKTVKTAHLLGAKLRRALIWGRLR